MGFVVALSACVEGGALHEAQRNVLGDPVEECGPRAGGAVVTFDVLGERLMVWSTHAAFIRDAEKMLQGERPRIPVFERLLEGRDCDPQWSWHVDPAQMYWTEQAAELCDGSPSDVEGNKPYWFGRVKRFCPWDATVVGVERR